MKKYRVYFCKSLHDYDSFDKRETMTIDVYATTILDIYRAIADADLTDGEEAFIEGIKELRSMSDYWSY